MEMSIYNLLWLILILSAIVCIAVHAIYQWKIASVKPSLIETFRVEAEKDFRIKMSAEITAHEAVIQDYKRKIKNAQMWLAARKAESSEITQPIYDDLSEIRTECLKIRGASRQLIEATNLINGLSRHKNFMESITKSQKSRLQSAGRDAKAELKAVELEVTELKARVDKAEQKLNSTAWIHEEPPLVRELESDDDTLV